MPTQERLRPHQPPLEMLHPHRPLRPIQPLRPIRPEGILILQVRRRDHDRRARPLLEPQLPVPRHVLDREQGAVGDDDEVQVAVGDEHAVRGFDDLREDVLDGVGGEVAFGFGPGAEAAGEDGVFAADGPGGVGGVQGGFDVGAVEVRGWRADGVIEELRGEGEHVPEEGALLVDLVDVEAGVNFEGFGVDEVEDEAGLVGGAGVVEEEGRLGAWRREGEVFGAVVGVAAGFVEGVEL